MPKLKKILCIVGVVVFVPFAMLSSCDTSVGQRVGVIVKVADEGKFMKTHEAELIRGGMSNGGGAFGAKPFDFTISNSKVYKDAMRAMQTQHEVNVSYHCELYSFHFSNTADNCFADNITEIK